MTTFQYHNRDVTKNPQNFLFFTIRYSNVFRKVNDKKKKKIIFLILNYYNYYYFYIFNEIFLFIVKYSI